MMETIYSLGPWAHPWIWAAGLIVESVVAAWIWHLTILRARRRKAEWLRYMRLHYSDPIEHIPPLPCEPDYHARWN